jgi:transposase
VAHFHIKTKKGRPYLYVREIARVNGRPTVVSQVYVGAPERVRELASGRPEEEVRLKVEEFGSLLLAQWCDRGIDVAGLVDGVVPRAPRETGPTVGEYFLYAAWNRMVEAVSKHALGAWYGHTAVQQLRPVELAQLTSERYWEKWNRVSEENLREIARRFFAKVWEAEQAPTDCLLFDTTNYYTYMASGTDSELARRGHSKEGRHQLRQVGLALLVDRGSRLPLFYREYPGNLHDSRLFEALMEEMFGTVFGLRQTTGSVTVVMDKGMNSKANLQWIDHHPRVHFVTTYSPHFAEALAALPLERFAPVPSVRNQRLAEAGRTGERLLACRSHGEFWGRDRTVVVTYNPAAARKQAHALRTKLEELRQELLKMRAKVRGQERQWRDPETVRERCRRVCGRLHLPPDLYAVAFTSPGGRLAMSFRKDFPRLRRKQALLGRNLVVTDRSDWTTAAIVEAHLDRWQVEDRFRQSKHPTLVAARPVRHWTDGKIRCHLFTCLVALTYLRRLELGLQRAGIDRTANEVMRDLRRLHSVLGFRADSRKPRRRIETPTKTQAEVLAALGYLIDDCGVLQAT